MQGARPQAPPGRDARASIAAATPYHHRLGPEDPLTSPGFAYSARCPLCGSWAPSDVPPAVPPPAHLVDDAQTVSSPPAPEPVPDPAAIRQDPRSKREKAYALMACISALGLTVGQALDLMFDDTQFSYNAATAEDLSLSHAQSYAQMVGAFLRGRSSHRVSHVLARWMRHSSGLPALNHPERSQMYSLTTPWTEFRHARSILTGWAAQTCAAQLAAETREIIKPEHGLHAMIKTPLRPSSTTASSSLSSGSASAPKRLLVKWSDLGETTVSEAGQLFEAMTPLLWGFLDRVTKKKRRPYPSGAVRVEYRPARIVITGVIGQLLFCRRRTVNVLALQRSLTLFATRASTIVYRFESRFACTTTFNTLLDGLRTAGNERIAYGAGIAHSATRWFKLIFDNVQRYNRQHEMRFGRQNAMLKGAAGTLVEMVRFSPEAWDLDEKLRLIALGRRYDVTTETLFDLIDHEHVHIVRSLHWLQVIVEYIPELESLRPEVERMFHELAAKAPVAGPVRKTNVISLRSNAADLSYTSGVATAVDDFLGTQLGQTKDNWNRRIVIVGGDGATYEGLLRLKRQRQNHDTHFEKYDFVEPEPEFWHMKWTDLSRIFAAHCGPEDSNDPSTLRASLSLIGRKVPSNLLKVEFDSSLDSLMLIGMARMLDCWRVMLDPDCYDILEYFTEKASTNNLPSLDHLFELAQKLENTYSSVRAHACALKTRTRQPADARAPEDPEWLRKMSNEETGEAGDFGGDRLLANANSFLNDFLDIREWCHSTAAGEIGRVWEMVKLVSFKFAGSGHNPRYLAYVLDTILSIEFECSPPLRTSRMENWLVNLSGLPGHYVEGDHMQEHFIKPLTAHSQRANAAYDGDFERNVLSPNLDNLVQLTRRMEAAVGLRQRSQKHTAMHCKPELRTLLRFYRTEDLHRFCVGRSHGHKAPSHFAAGYAKMPTLLNTFLSNHKGDSNVFDRSYTETGDNDNEMAAGGDGEEEERIEDDDEPDEPPDIYCLEHGTMTAVGLQDVDVDIEGALGYEGSDDEEGDGDGEQQEGDEEDDIGMEELLQRLSDDDGATA
ncbi:hypothetical protein EXIGLDRAFT_843839 [Exidia glandulosa HHB12029]|uniref:DUF6589 domain-containing protein n=1 Tax=Exidia glandulosa HHB12029 TaxID=1314781 RepID=A0A165ZFY0_EXIGL|nr:hypothetical protein EXIGLDRAFT_843839 [Exidia glandulosa HHB12029]